MIGARLQYEGTKERLFLELWVSVVAKAGFDEIFSEVPVAAGHLRVYAQGAPNAEQRARASAAPGALQTRAYRASDLYYFQPNPKFYERLVLEGSAAESDSAQEIAAEMKTPGSYADAVDQYGLSGVPVPQINGLSVGEAQNWVRWDALQASNHQLQFLATGAVSGIRSEHNCCATTNL
jgi:hypothetical protein